MAMSRRLAAESIGTFMLVLAGCGAAVIASAFPGVGIGLLGVALAFGLTVLTMAYAVGHISGGPFNPAVTVGLSLARRFEGAEPVAESGQDPATTVTSVGELGGRVLTAPPSAGANPPDAGVR